MGLRDWIFPTRWFRGQRLGSLGGWGDHRYAAFISYSHADTKVATWLEKRLRKFRAPDNLVGSWTPFGPVPARFTGVFRDRSSQAVHQNLSGALSAALDSSASLILVCSPSAAKSEHVNNEVEHFIATGKGDRIFCLIVDGSPGDPDTECFPPALLFNDQIGDGNDEDLRTDPIAADIRPDADGRALGFLKLVAGMLDVDLAFLSKDERRARRRRVVFNGLIVLTIALGLTSTALLTLTLDQISASSRLIKASLYKEALEALQSEDYSKAALFALEGMQPTSSLIREERAPGEFRAIVDGAIMANPITTRSFGDRQMKALPAPPNDPKYKEQGLRTFVSSNGLSVIVSNARFQVADLEKQTVEFEQTFDTSMVRFALFDDPSQLLIGHVNGQVDVWDINDRKKQLTFFPNGTADQQDMRPIKFANGRLITRHKINGVVLSKLWDTSSGNLLAEFPGNIEVNLQVTYALSKLDNHRRLVLGQTESGQVRPTGFFVPTREFVEDIKISASGNLAFSAGRPDRLTNRDDQRRYRISIWAPQTVSSGTSHITAFEKKPGTILVDLPRRDLVLEFLNLSPDETTLAIQSKPDAFWLCQLDVSLGCSSSTDLSGKFRGWVGAQGEHFVSSGDARTLTIHRLKEDGTTEVVDTYAADRWHIPHDHLTFVALNNQEATVLNVRPDGKFISTGTLPFADEFSVLNDTTIVTKLETSSTVEKILWRLSNGRWREISKISAPLESPETRRFSSHGNFVIELTPDGQWALRLVDENGIGEVIFEQEAETFEFLHDGRLVRTARGDYRLEDQQWTFLASQPCIGFYSVDLETCFGSTAPLEAEFIELRHYKLNKDANRWIPTDDSFFEVITDAGYYTWRRSVSSPLQNSEHLVIWEGPNREWDMVDFCGDTKAAMVRRGCYSIIDLSSGEVTGHYPHQPFEFGGIGYINEKAFAIATTTHQVEVRDTIDGSLRNTLSTTGEIWNLFLSDDGRRVIIDGEKNSSLWNTDTAEIITELVGKPPVIAQTDTHFAVIDERRDTSESYRGPRENTDAVLSLLLWEDGTTDRKITLQEIDKASGSSNSGILRASDNLETLYYRSGDKTLRIQNIQNETFRDFFLPIDPIGGFTKLAIGPRNDVYIHNGGSVSRIALSGKAAPKIFDGSDKKPCGSWSEKFDASETYFVRMYVDYSDCMAEVMDVSSGRVLNTFSLDITDIWQTARHPTASEMAFVPHISTQKEGAKQVQIRRLPGGEKIGDIPVIGDLHLIRAAYSPNGEYLALLYADGQIHLWDRAGLTRVTILKPKTPWHIPEDGYRIPNAYYQKGAPLQFGRNGKFLAAGSNDGTVQIYDVQRGTVWKTITTGDEKGKIYRLDASFEQNRLLTVSNRGGAKLWNLTNGSLIAELMHPESTGLTSWLLETSKPYDDVNDAIFGADGRIIFTSGKNGLIKIWSGRSGRLISVHTDPKELADNVFSFSEDRSTIALGTILTGKVILFDGQTGVRKGHLKPFKEWIGKYHLSPSGNQLYVGSDVYGYSDFEESALEWLIPLGQYLPTDHTPHSICANYPFSRQSLEKSEVAQLGVPESLTGSNVCIRAQNKPFDRRAIARAYVDTIACPANNFIEAMGWTSRNGFHLFPYFPVQFLVEDIGFLLELSASCALRNTDLPTTKTVN